MLKQIKRIREVLDDRRLKATGKLQVIQELTDEAFLNDNAASEEPDEDTDDEDDWGEDEDDEDE